MNPFDPSRPFDDFKRMTNEHKEKLSEAMTIVTQMIQHLAFEEYPDDDDPRNELRRIAIVGSLSQTAIAMIVTAALYHQPGMWDELHFAIDRWRQGIDVGVETAGNHRGKAQDPGNTAH